MPSMTLSATFLGKENTHSEITTFFSVWPFEKIKNDPPKLTGQPVPGSEIFGSTDLRKREYEKKKKKREETQERKGGGAHIHFFQRPPAPGIPSDWSDLTGCYISILKAGCSCHSERWQAASTLACLSLSRLPHYLRAWNRLLTGLQLCMPLVSKCNFSLPRSNQAELSSKSLPNMSKGLEKALKPLMI